MPEFWLNVRIICCWLSGVATLAGSNDAPLVLGGGTSVFIGGGLDDTGLEDGVGPVFLKAACKIKCFFI